MQVVANGPDAAAAVREAGAGPGRRLRRRGLHARACAGDDHVSASAAPPPRRQSADPNLLLGVPASPGLAVGEVFQVRRAEIVVVETGHRRRRASVATWPRPLAPRSGQLAALRAQLHAKADPAKAAIFAAHEELLADPDLLEIAESAIAKGKSAAFAWKNAVTTHADRLAGMRNQLLAQRANDVRDVGAARAVGL